MTLRNFRFQFKLVETFLFDSFNKNTTKLVDIALNDATCRAGEYKALSVKYCLGDL